MAKLTLNGNVTATVRMDMIVGVDRLDEGTVFPKVLTLDGSEISVDKECALRVVEGLQGLVE